MYVGSTLNCMKFERSLARAVFLIIFFTDIYVETDLTSYCYRLVIIDGYRANGTPRPVCSSIAKLIYIRIRSSINLAVINDGVKDVRQFGNCKRHRWQWDVGRRDSRRDKWPTTLAHWWWLPIYALCVYYRRNIWPRRQETLAWWTLSQVPRANSLICAKAVRES